MGIEQEVLARVKPSPQVNENIHAAVEKLVQLVESTSVAKEEAFEICLVGSIAKGTHLIAPDIDLFMLFDPSLPREKLTAADVVVDSLEEVSLEAVERLFERRSADRTSRTP